MSGREQPYLDGTGTGSYAPTAWLDDVPGIQEGTPQDEQHFNNMEAGINSVNLFAEFIAEVVNKQSNTLSNMSGDTIAVSLVNSLEYPFNNSVKTVALPVKRDSIGYTVTAEIQGDTTNVGDIVVYDKQVNGFKVKFTGSASTVSLKLYVQGGNAA